jgi:hypothetical protein
LIPLIGYSPDLPGFTPGTITNCSAMVPSLKGMKGAPSPQNTTLVALDAACKGGAVVRKLDDSTRFFAGTTTDLYEASTSSWTERTRASGGDYALGTETRWRFAMLGDTAIATAKTDILQTSASGAFANAAADAPRAGSVAVVNGFVILIDVNDQGAIFDSADRPHGWWAARSLATWTPSIANEAYTGSLTSTPGKCTAIKRFGRLAIIYKERSMFTLSYAGTSGWEANQIPGEAGALSQESVVDIGTPQNPLHLFMGAEDFYMFDGARAYPLGAPLTKTVFGEINRDLAYVSMTLHDRAEKNVYFFYPLGSSGNPDKCVVYNYQTKQWGRDDRPVEAVVEYIEAGVIYDDLGNFYPTYNDFPVASYDTAFWSAGFPSPAIFNQSHVVQTLNAPSTNSSMILGDYGSDEFVSLMSRLQPLFTTRPTQASMTNYYRSNLGDSLTTGTISQMDSKGRFDKFWSAIWHRFQFEFAGPVEFGAVRVDIKKDGLE